MSMPRIASHSIQYRNLGPSGLRVSTIGLGCNNFGRAKTVTETQEGTDAVINAAIESGITFFDTADIYGKVRGLSETLMGNSLDGKRDRIVLASKFGMDMEGANGPDWGARGSRRYIRLAVEASLRRLQTDWIDLYQLHEPDTRTPIEAEVLPAVREYGLGFLPFFPLYNGIFTGKYTRSGGPADARVTTQKPHLMGSADWPAIEHYQAFCDERGVTMLVASFAWLLAQPGLTSVIAGRRRPSRSPRMWLRRTPVPRMPRNSPRSTRSSPGPGLPYSYGKSNTTLPRPWPVSRSR